MSSICATCLSTERHLVPVGSSIYIMDILKDVSLCPSDSICWECRATFTRSWRFRHQVLTAQGMLLQNRLSEITIKPECLSRLSVHHIQYDTSCYATDAVKREPSDDDPSNAIPNLIKVEEFTIDDSKEVHKFDDVTGLDSDCDSNIDDDTKLDDNINVDDNSDERNASEDDLEDETDGMKIAIGSVAQDNVVGKKEQFTVCTTLLHGRGVMEEVIVELMATESRYDIAVMSEEEMWRWREKEMVRFRKGPHNCVKCLMQYNSQSLYGQHKVKKHAGKFWYLTCSICEIRLANTKLYSAHLARHYLQYSCRKCDFRNQMLRRMLEHDKREHRQLNFSCKTCGKEFMSSKRLQYHRTREHMQLPPCGVCGKTFLSKSGYKYHMKCHDGTTMYKCDICQKDYTGKQGLRAHLRLHDASLADENAYCAECNIQFSDTYRYRQHLKVNSKHRLPGDLKYKCSHCKKQFYNKTSLGLHEKCIHLNRREFACGTCDKAFTRRDRLEAHVAHDHEKLPRPRDHVCNYCNKAFTKRQILVNHVRTHTGERPYECGICHTKFTQRTTLSTHVKGVHEKSLRRPR